MTTRATMLRLQREIVELEKEPLQGVRYHFCDDDMKHMCLILTPSSGPFTGLPLHLKVFIPDAYPRSPPRVYIQTHVKHPNVLTAGFICCDILRPRSERNVQLMDYNGGYTPAYLLKYIFYQILSFFSVDEVDQDYGGKQSVVDDRYESASAFRKRAEAEVRGYVCEACGFNVAVTSSEPIPPGTSAVQEVQRRCTPTPSLAVSAMDIDVPELKQRIQCSLGKLDADSWLRILDNLSDQDMHSLARAWPPVKQLQQNALIRRQLVCFYLRKTHTESVLGIGIRLAVEDHYSSGAGRPRSGFVPMAASVQMLDLLSQEAYSEHGVRTGIYGENFDVFLPIAIDSSYFCRGETPLKDAIMLVHRAWVGTERATSWPLCIVDVLSRLMNHNVLALVNDCDEHLQNPTRSQAPEGLSRHQRCTVKRSSEKALQGYCLLLDLFQTLTNRYPEVEQELRNRVHLFQSSQEGRHKTHTPDLGQFLTYLLVLKEDWTSYTLPFTRELLSRNVVWYLNGNPKSGTPGLPHLAHLEDPNVYVSLLRLHQTFKASAASLKLSMFQVTFLRQVRHSHYGYPSAEDSSEMFLQAQAIYAVKNWDACLRIWEHPIPDPSDWQRQVCKMLVTAVSDSERSKYHVTPYKPPQLYKWRLVAEPTCPRPRGWASGELEKTNVRFVKPGSLSFFPRNRTCGSKP